MSEIHIEKNNKKQAWPWILGALLVLALVSWIVWDNVLDPDRAEVAAADEYFDADPISGNQLESATDANTAYVPGEVTVFSNFINAADTKAKMGLDHEYTSNGIQYLAEALTRLSNNANLDEVVINQHRDLMLQRAQQIQKNEASLKHANYIHEAFIAAANWMEIMKDNGYAAASTQIDKVHSAAKTIDPNQQTLNQKDRIKAFFERSENALQAMVTAQE